MRRVFLGREESQLVQGVCVGLQALDRLDGSGLVRMGLGLFE